MAGRRGGGLLAVAGLMLAVLFSLQGSSFGQVLLNITKILEPYPEYSQLSQWFTQTKVDQEINNRSTITILAAPNTIFQTFLSGANAYANPDSVADTLRYQILLQYYGPTELSQLPTNGTAVTTLLQTTGRANETQGFVTLYKNGTTYLVGHRLPDRVGNETIVTNVTQSPYVYSVLQVNRVLSPVSTAFTPVPAPAPVPIPTPPPSNSTATPATPAVPPALTPPATPPAVTTQTPTTVVPAEDDIGFASPKGRIGVVTLICAMLLSSMVAALS